MESVGASENKTVNESPTNTSKSRVMSQTGSPNSPVWPPSDLPILFSEYRYVKLQTFVPTVVDNDVQSTVSAFVNVFLIHHNSIHNQAGWWTKINQTLVEY